MIFIIKFRNSLLWHIILPSQIVTQLQVSISSTKVLFADYLQIGIKNHLL